MEWLKDVPVRAALVTAIAGFVGVVVGAILSSLATGVAERRRWRREDQVRFLADRRAAYVAFLTEVNRAINLKVDQRAVSAGEYVAVMHALAAIEVIGSAEALKAARAFNAAVMDQLVNPGTKEFNVSELGTRRATFLLCVRRELGVELNEVGAA